MNLQPGIWDAQLNGLTSEKFQGVDPLMCIRFGLYSLKSRMGKSFKMFILNDIQILLEMLKNGQNCCL